MNEAKSVKFYIYVIPPYDHHQMKILRDFFKSLFENMQIIFPIRYHPSFQIRKTRFTKKSANEIFFSKTPIISDAIIVHSNFLYDVLRFLFWLVYILGKSICFLLDVKDLSLTYLGLASNKIKKMPIIQRGTAANANAQILILGIL